MLFRVVEVRLHPNRAPDFKRAIEFATDARQLIDTGEQLLQVQEEQVRVEHTCALLAQLNRHPLYHSEYLAQYRALSGCEDVVLKDNIQAEIDRLFAYVPQRPYQFSSDPQSVRGGCTNSSRGAGAIPMTSNSLPIWQAYCCASTGWKTTKS